MQIKDWRSFKVKAQRNNKPAYSVFSGRVTQSLIKEHGSYAAAKAYLEMESSNAQPAPRT